MNKDGNKDGKPMLVFSYLIHIAHQAVCVCVWGGGGQGSGTSCRFSLSLPLGTETMVSRETGSDRFWLNTLEVDPTSSFHQRMQEFLDLVRPSPSFSFPSPFGRGSG